MVFIIYHFALQMAYCPAWLKFTVFNRSETNSMLRLVGHKETPCPRPKCILKTPIIIIIMMIIGVSNKTM